MNAVARKIKGMRFNGCTANVQSVSERQSGIKRSVASLKDKQARILHDSSVATEDRLVREIEWDGCSATSSSHD
jgi:cation transport ATPase